MPLDGPKMDIPFITVDQMREVDRAMEEDYHIELVQMMENAGLALANLASRRFLDGNPREQRVLVMAGTGGNGGGGLVCARRLRNRGATVEVWLTQQGEGFKGIPGHQLDILRRMGTPLHVPGEEVELPQADLLIDALIGYSLRGAPTGRRSCPWTFPAGSTLRRARSMNRPCRLRPLSRWPCPTGDSSWSPPGAASESCIWPISAYRQSSISDCLWDSQLGTFLPGRA